VGRRSGLEGFLRATSRAMAAAERERQRQQRQAAAETRRQERQVRITASQLAREIKLVAKQAKEDYVAARQEECDDLNDEIADRIVDLGKVLSHTLTIDDTIQFNSLQKKAQYKPFIVPQQLRQGVAPKQQNIAPLGFWQKLIPGANARHAAKVELLRAKWQKQLDAFELAEKSKSEEVSALRRQYDTNRAQYEAQIDDHNAAVAQLEQEYFAKLPGAVVTYCEMVLERSEYPTEGFPQHFRIAYDADSGAMIVEYELPHISVIPTESEYRYLKTKDLIDSKPRKTAEIKQIYRQLIAEIALRTIHEIFEADQAEAVSVLTFNGVIDTHDPASGHAVRVPVISVRTTKAAFTEIRLDRVEALACLRSLGATVSSRPDELQAVKPVVEFNMIDRRFIDQADALSEIESRRNLMDLSPSEFEVLVANLFGKMGLETKLTRSSRDGGVDAVAYDTRPILGGKVVIQAKRYQNTVGVSAVRDLYGTMMNEGANKGILVATSRFGPDAYTFASDKPIELIDGSGLLYLLKEHAGLDAIIVMPAPSTAQ
jgi:restriction system protein